MRRAHILADNKAMDYPQQCIWFDTETKFEVEFLMPDNSVMVVWFNNLTEFKLLPGDTCYQHLKVGYACYMRRHHSKEWTDEEWFKFTTRTDFWRWICSKNRERTKLYLLCHNTSFDLPVLDVFHELPALGYRLRSAIIDAPPTILRFRLGTKCIMILDTLNIWRMPLEELGKNIGVEKYEMPEDNDLGISWDTYGRRDVEIIRDATLRWIEFLEKNEMGSFAPTLASQSMRAFRHKYMHHTILIDSDERALNLTREGYYGGRVECFRLGKYTDRFSLLDINSQYPSVMAAHEYPCKLVAYTRFATLQDLHIWLQQYCLTVRVILRTTKPFCPVRDGHKLIFPIGEFEAILSTPEIRYALAHGEIVSILEVAVYEKAFVFTKMMFDMYAKRNTARDAGRPVEAFMWRKLMNSFYGKWGQSGGKWKDEDNIDDLSCMRWTEYDAVENKIIHHRQLGGLKQVKDEERECRDSFPAIAGHVTAYARMVLWDCITQAGIGNVYYCDTDSLLVNPVGRRNLEFRIDPRELGKLSVKGEYDDIEIWGAKDYRFGPKSKTKGVRGKDAVWIDDHNIHQTKWNGLRGLISAGIVDRAITQRIRKHLNRLYDKGEVLSDGTVQPRLLPE